MTTATQRWAEGRAARVTEAVRETREHLERTFRNLAAARVELRAMAERRAERGE